MPHKRKADQNGAIRASKRIKAVEAAKAIEAANNTIRTMTRTTRATTKLIDMTTKSTKTATETTGAEAKSSKASSKTSKATKLMVLIPAAQDVQSQNSGDKADKNKFSFLDLPAEVRVMIYKHAFHESHIDIKISRDRSEISARARPAKDFAYALLKTCKLVRREAFEIGFRAVSLRWLKHNVFYHHFYQTIKQLNIPHETLGLIKKIKYCDTTEVLTPWMAFSSLKEVTLEHRVCTFAGIAPQGEKTVQRKLKQYLSLDSRFPIGMAQYLNQTPLWIGNGPRLKMTRTVWYLNPWIAGESLGWDLEYDHVTDMFIKTRVVIFRKRSTHTQRQKAKHNWVLGWDVSRTTADVEAEWAAEPISLW